MKMLNLGHLKEARVFYEPVQELTSSENCYKFTETVAQSEGFNAERFFAVELNTARHISSYVLVGAKCSPVCSKKEISVNISYTDTLKENYNDTIAFNKETVFKGLDKTYVKAVVKAVQEFCAQNSVRIGTIDFNTAALCTVKSSPWILAQATKLVLTVLMAESFPPSDNDVKELCLKALSGE